MKDLIGMALLGAGLGILCALSCALSIKTYIMTPDVEFSYSTKQCVRVILADESEGRCGALPTKYNKVWVK